MDETQRREPTRYREEQFEDEIELMDYLRVIWKWKYVIIAGTVVCGLAAAIISFTMFKQQSKIYRVGMVLRPGIKKVDKNGKKDYIDSPANIKTLIEGDLKYEISNYGNRSRLFPPIMGTGFTTASFP